MGRAPFLLSLVALVPPLALAQAPLPRPLDTSLPVDLSSAPLSHLVQGFFGAAQLGTSGAGVAAIAELGLASHGIQDVRGGQWLLQWDERLSALEEALVRTLPVDPLIGGTAFANVEVGRRFGARAWTPYVAVGGTIDLRALGALNVPFSGVPVLNATAANEGVGEIQLSAAVRVAVGASWRHRDHAILLTAFGESGARRPDFSLPPMWINGGGLRFRWDVPHKYTLVVSAFFGASPHIGVPGLGLTRQTSVQELEGTLRYRFENGTWFGLQLAVAREAALLRYQTAQTTYATSRPPAIALSLQYALQLGDDR